MRISITFVLACLGSAALLGQDVLKVASGSAKVEHEDSQIRVIRFKEPPGQKMAMHSHPAYVAIGLTNDATTFTLPDGKSAEEKGKPRQVTFANPVTHASLNSGTGTSETIFIELKTKPAGVKLTGDGDLVKTNPKLCKVEVDNEYVRITRINVPAHGKLEMHSHPSANVAVYFDGGHLKTTTADGQVQDATIAPGTVRVNPAGKHSNENLGDKPSEAVLIELKTAPK